MLTAIANKDALLQHAFVLKSKKFKAGFVVLAYDVHSKRVSKVMKTVKKYLLPIQRSVFEGYLTEAQVKQLKKELLPCIDLEHDAVVLYKSTYPGMIVKDCIGCQRDSSSVFL